MYSSLQRIESGAFPRLATEDNSYNQNRSTQFHVSNGEIMNQHDSVPIRQAFSIPATCFALYGGSHKARPFSSRLAALTLAAALPLAFTGCHTHVDDATLTTRVQTALAADTSISQQQQQVSVVAQNGVVTLTGNLSDDTATAVAAQDAARVSGVKEVVNDLSVAGVAVPPTITSPTAPTAPRAATGPGTGRDLASSGSARTGRKRRSTPAGVPRHNGARRKGDPGAYYPIARQPDHADQRRLQRHRHARGHRERICRDSGRICGEWGGHRVA